MVKIDVKDRKLLYYLSRNARESHKKLGKKIGLSENSIKYRIEKLTREGIIKNFTATINLTTFNHNTFAMLLRFNEDIYTKSEIIKYFKEHDSVIWFVSLSGQWDLFIEFSSENYNHLTNIIQEIRQHFQETLNSYKTFFTKDTLRVEHLIESFYSDLKFPQLPVKPRAKESIKLDKKDKKILNLIAQDSSTSYMQIAEKLNLTFDIVRYRLKNLLEKEVIVKFFPEINLTKLGYTEYLFRIKLENISKIQFNKLRTEISDNTNITFAFYDINTNSFLFICAFKSPDEIDHLSRNLRKRYTGVIKEQEYLIVKEQIYFNLFPKKFLKE